MLTLGPSSPIKMGHHSLLEVHGDAFIFGGQSSYNRAIFQLTCSSGICSWSTLNQAVKNPRDSMVAIRVPNSFCLEEGEGTTTT